MRHYISLILAASFLLSCGGNDDPPDDPPGDQRDPSSGDLHIYVGEGGAGILETRWEAQSVAGQVRLFDCDDQGNSALLVERAIDPEEINVVGRQLTVPLPLIPTGTPACGVEIELEGGVTLMGRTEGETAEDVTFQVVLGKIVQGYEWRAESALLPEQPEDQFSLIAELSEQGWLTVAQIGNPPDPKLRQPTCDVCIDEGHTVYQSIYQQLTAVDAPFLLDVDQNGELNDGDLELPPTNNGNSEIARRTYVALGTPISGLSPAGTEGFILNVEMFTEELQASPQNIPTREEVTPLWASSPMNLKAVDHDEGSGLYVAVGQIDDDGDDIPDRGVIATSFGGTAWGAWPHETPLRGVTYLPAAQRWLAVGHPTDDNPNNLFESKNGYSWSALGAPVLAGERLNDIGHLELNGQSSILLAVSQEGSVAYSEDYGENWITGSSSAPNIDGNISATPVALRRVIPTNESAPAFVVIGEDNTVIILESPDTLDLEDDPLWSQVPHDPASLLGDGVADTRCGHYFVDDGEVRVRLTGLYVPAAFESLDTPKAFLDELKFADGGSLGLYAPETRLIELPEDGPANIEGRTVAQVRPELALVGGLGGIVAQVGDPSTGAPTAAEWLLQLNDPTASINRISAF